MKTSRGSIFKKSPVKDRYHDVSMKGVEYLRGVYMASGIRIRPKIKMNRIDALKEILQTWGLDPQKILSQEALAQLTPTTNQEQANNRDLAILTKTSETQHSRALLRARGLKKNETPILAGYQIFHNYIRPHEGLEGKTPAEACGIKIEGKNKWITLIQNASRKNS